MKKTQKSSVARRDSETQKPETTPAAVPVPTQPPALQPALDPMNVAVSNLSPEQEQEVHDALLARILGRLSSMGIWELRSLLWYTDIEAADDGCDTPAEAFITSLVLHQSIRPLTPDDAARKLEEFRDNFDGMVQGARNFTAKYPEAVNPAA